MGFRNPSPRLVNVIDLGLAQKFRDPKLSAHIPYKQDGFYGIGTFLFAATNMHFDIVRFSFFPSPLPTLPRRHHAPTSSNHPPRCSSTSIAEPSRGTKSAPQIPLALFLFFLRTSNVPNVWPPPNFPHRPLAPSPVRTNSQIRTKKHAHQPQRQYNPTSVTWDFSHNAKLEAEPRLMHMPPKFDILFQCARGLEFDDLPDYEGLRALFHGLAVRASGSSMVACTTGLFPRPLLPLPLLSWKDKTRRTGQEEGKRRTVSERHRRRCCEVRRKRREGRASAETERVWR